MLVTEKEMKKKYFKYLHTAALFPGKLKKASGPYF